MHPVSQRRPGSQAVMRDSARADAIRMLYPYSQMLANRCGEKQGRAAVPSRASIPLSHSLKSSLPASSHAARARWPGGNQRLHINWGHKHLLPIDSHVSRLRLELCFFRSIDGSAHPTQVKTTSNKSTPKCLKLCDFFSPPPGSGFLNFSHLPRERS